MISKARQTYLKTILDQVVFVFDHGSIREELLQHMEDLEAHFEQQGLDTDQTDEKILYEMGDPILIGQELNRVHNPWLGWLWIASKVMLVILSVYTLTLAYNRQLMALRYTTEIRNPEVDYTQVFSTNKGPAIVSDITSFDIREVYDLGDYRVILEGVGYHDDGRMVILYQVVRSYDFLEALSPLPNLNLNSKLILEDGSEILPANADSVVALGSDLFAVFFEDLPQPPSSFTLDYEESVLGFEYNFGGHS